MSYFTPHTAQFGFSAGSNLNLFACGMKLEFVCRKEIVATIQSEHGGYYSNISIWPSTIFCTKKIKSRKLTQHNYLTLCSMKNFSNEICEEALGKLTFPDYENFSCVNKAFSDLTSKTSDVVNNMTSTKTNRVKNNINDWFDGEITKIATRDLQFWKFWKSKLRVNEII